MPDSNLSFALRYADAGYKIFPLYEAANGICACGKADCQSKGKHPRLAQWDGRASSDPKVIKIWWEQWPLANLGMPLPGLVVLDIDPRNNGDANLDMLLSRHGALPRTMTQRTGGGGSHYLFKANGGTYGKAIDSGVDLKFGEHQYICVEPSVHATGQRYVWLDEESPFEGGVIADAPHWLAKVVSPVITGILPGGRDNALSNEAYHLRKIGLQVEEIEAVISKINDAMPVPLPAEDIHRIAFGKRRITANKPEIKPEYCPPAGFGLLLNKNMREIMQFSKPWISEGVTLLAGRPKIGKTTLARQLAICLGLGKPFLDSATKQSKVLFLSLEENERIFRRKLEMMGCPHTLNDCLVVFEWPRGLDGAAMLGKYLDEHPEIEVIIIDSLTRIRDLPTANKNVFMQDYEAMRMFHGMLSSLSGKALIMLHQTRKGKSEDVIEDISGSFGLTAACDSYFVFRTEKDGKYVLHCGGRLWDSDDDAFELARQNNEWSLLSPYSSRLNGQDLTAEQDEALEYLTKSGGMTPTELGQALKISRTAAYYRLNGLINKEKAKTERGVYYAI